MNIAEKAPQQIFVGRGRKTIAVYGSAAGQVGIHEIIGMGEPSRYIISLDGKLKKQDAIGFPGGWCFGITKSEATKAAKSLSSKINSIAITLEAAKKSTLNGAELLVTYNQSAWDNIVSKYCAEVLQ